MYDSFYGFTARPFQLTPDPRFWFESATHRTAMSYLGYGLAQGEGFIVITGEVGSGKTTLVGHVMKSIDPSRLTAARLVSTQVADADLLRLVCDAFGIAAASPAKSDALAAIETFLHEEARAGRRTLLIVDEAQNLDFSALEELRMLSNFQLGETSLLQIFLLAQPEFRATLASPQLEQLRQRVIATHHLEAMLPEEIEPYLIHRLSLVGWRENPVFAPGVYDELWRASAGIPRRVNSIVNRLLLHGAVEERHMLDGDDVRAVVDDMGLSREELSEPVTGFAPAPAPASAPAFASGPAVAPELAPRMEPQPVVAPAPVPVSSAHPAPGFAASSPAPSPMGVSGEEGKKQKIAALTEQTEQLKQQIAALEQRCDEQDAAIRRILGLLIDWVEQGEEPSATAARGRAA
ncbi:AAA family ATPase [Sphingomonas lacunae]|uniref:AAA family ATPase n=1 Tax=Sphingomonas lacunae TaxID=2698828 RepID=A0A6M4AWA3_9SPHN|nr:XrtA/PEP-CTERM system-associated ATPase [Sphingomonas lacunae]QJQ32640.1 AAA family ATPase [Sphingomonas lacunae]